MRTNGIPNDVLSNLNPFALISTSRSHSLVAHPTFAPFSHSCSLLALTHHALVRDTY